MADATPSTPYGSPYFSSVKADNIDPQSNIGAGNGAVSLGDVSKLVSNIGKPNGVATLDANGNLVLPDGEILQPALSVEPATQTQAATLKPLLTLDESAKVRTASGDVALSDMATTMQDGDYLTVLGGAVVARPSVTGTVPSDFTVNGNVYVAPASYVSNPSSLPAGLSVDAGTGIVLTDGSVFFPNTINNIGVLCAVSE